MLKFKFNNIATQVRDLACLPNVWISNNQRKNIWLNILNIWLEGKYGNKTCITIKATGIPEHRQQMSIRGSQSGYWGWCQSIKSRQTQMSLGKELPRSYSERCLSWSREKKSSTAARLTKVFFLEQSKILHFIWKSRSWSLRCLKSSVKFVRILVVMSSADLGDSWSSVFYQIYSMLRSFIDMLILLSIRN